MAGYDFPFLIPTLPAIQEWAPLLEASYAARHYSNGGPLSLEFNQKLKRAYLEDDYQAIAVTSNTLGLQAVMHALDLRGKRVGLPDFTFAATLQAVLAAGALPVIFDVDSDTTELDAQGVDDYLNDGGKLDVIIHVRCFGFARDLSPIRDVSSRHGVPLIVDAAAALGVPGERTFGMSGEIEVFSLHATKVFAVGEGGMIAAPKQLHDRIKAGTNFGFQEDRRFLDGTNAKIDEFRCAIGLTMLEKVEGIIHRRRAHAAKYISYFNETGFGRPVCSDLQNSWSMFPVIMNEPVEDQLIRDLYSVGVETRRYYFPCLSIGYLGSQSLEISANARAIELNRRMLCFPVYDRPVDEFWNELHDRFHGVLTRNSRVAT
ncbi:MULTISPECIES: DegT/DnrJ/EryC1/StrS family aminotransferase [Hyphobacterium]|uniref:DegT/DnrJ/EryC1/StrS family aminotransferase n=1 Tax=Hyphobacterium vulgare TaxID=1736751 RepID=A0ABV6ZVL0_9PROT